MDQHTGTRIHLPTQSPFLSFLISIHQKGLSSKIGNRLSLFVSSPCPSRSSLLFSRFSFDKTTLLGLTSTSPIFFIFYPTLDPSLSLSLCACVCVSFPPWSHFPCTDQNQEYNHVATVSGNPIPFATTQTQRFREDYTHKRPPSPYRLGLIIQF